MKLHIPPHSEGELDISVKAGEKTIYQIKTPLFMMQVLPPQVRRPTWPQRWQQVTDRAPKPMCGAAAACYCTCSTVATRGHATTRTRSVCRWDLLCSHKADVHLRELKDGTLTPLSTCSLRSLMGLRLCGRCRPTATTLQPNCSELDSRKSPRGERQQRSSEGRALKPSEQVRSADHNSLWSSFVNSD